MQIAYVNRQGIGAKLEAAAGFKLIYLPGSDGKMYAGQC